MQLTIRKCLQERINLYGNNKKHRINGVFCVGINVVRPLYRTVLQNPEDSQIRWINRKNGKKSGNQEQD